MSAEVTLQKVLQIAVANESLGAKFYATMAGNAQDDKTRDVFHKLAEEEKEHRSLFQKLVEQHEENTGGEVFSHNKGAYFKFLADNNIFATIIHAFEERDQDFTDIPPKDALSVGIQAEKDSILLYQELFASTTDEAVKEAISTLLEEEKMHLLELRQQLEEM